VAPEKLATAVARVAAIVGEGRVGRPVLPDSHAPESFTLGRFDPPAPPDDPVPATRTAGTSVLRVYRPPLDAEVRVGPSGPQAVRASGVSGWIVSCAGPWRLDTCWHDAPLRRDAFDVELSDGAAYRLLQDLVTGRWSVVGRYD
jgi:protein ImuB